MTAEVLRRIERYYDAVPRRFARVEELGPFTLFLGEPAGWVYYGRPRLGAQAPFDAAAVGSAMDRLGRLGLPAVLEWVHETTPDLLDAVRAEGSLDVEEIPLMLVTKLSGAATRDLPDGVSVRMLGDGEPDAVAASRAVADVGFAAAGTAAGAEGPDQRDSAGKAVQQRVLDLIREGALRVAVAEHPQHGVLATGRSMPVAGVTEIVGVATLPSARRQGLGGAVTAALVEDAHLGGVETVFLTASSEDVAQVYRRVGFDRIGTGYTAERLTPPG